MMSTEQTLIGGLVSTTSSLDSVQRLGETFKQKVEQPTLGVVQQGQSMPEPSPEANKSPGKGINPAMTSMKP